MYGHYPYAVSAVSGGTGGFKVAFPFFKTVYKPDKCGKSVGTCLFSVGSIFYKKAEVRKFKFAFRGASHNLRKRGHIVKPFDYRIAPFVSRRFPEGIESSDKVFCFFVSVFRRKLYGRIKGKLSAFRADLRKFVRAEKEHLRKHRARKRNIKKRIINSFKNVKNRRNFRAEKESFVVFAPAVYSAFAKFRKKNFRFSLYSAEKNADIGISDRA